MDKPKLKVSIIVPAYNEEKNIKNVLSLITKLDFIDEVVVVNDGSSDGTLSQLKEVNGIHLINLEENHGKAYAVATGMEKAEGDIILLIDADMMNLTSKIIKKMVDPLISGKYDAVLGYNLHNLLDHMCIPISGERAYFKKDLMPYVEEFKQKGYGLELYLNYLYKDKRIKLLELKGVSGIFKHMKQSPEVATKQQLDEWADIFKEISKNKNPLGFLIYAYLYPYYIRKPEKLSGYISKLSRSFKKSLSA